MFRKCIVGLLAVFCLQAFTGASCLPLFFSYWNNSGMPYIWLLVTMSLAIGGSEVLSISNATRIFYPLALVVPGLCILFIFGGGEQWASAKVSITTLLYVHMTIKVTNADYLSKI
jgi:hypothetical protein